MPGSIQPPTQTRRTAPMCAFLPFRWSALVPI